MHRFNRFLLWPLLLTGHLLAASLLSWHLLAQVDFGYGLGYRLLNIEQHIRTFGPQNRYREHFGETTRTEHLHLFGEITYSVQNRGEGLADIRYTLPDGNKAPLLREAEVIHLQDVANLITGFYILALIGAGIFVLLLAYAWRQHQTLPSLGRILTGFAAALVVLTFSVLVIGPTKVFYWLHEFAFPDEHEWFFYYQDSLMTTLMKAPDLFGFMAVLLVLLLAALWTASLMGMARLLKYRAQNSNSTNYRTT